MALVKKNPHPSCKHLVGHEGITEQQTIYNLDEDLFV
jgi:hypothetical protein